MRLGISASTSRSLIVVCLIVPLGFPRHVESQAAGVVFAVDSTVDAVDAVPGDGVCDDGSGACTLRAAVQESNALDGHDEVHVPPGVYRLELPPNETNDDAAGGDLDVTERLVLIGAGRKSVVIDGDGIDRVLDIAGDAGAGPGSRTSRCARVRPSTARACASRATRRCATSPSSETTATASATTSDSYAFSTAC
jgi:CSLREA domain-containing protein